MLSFLFCPYFPPIVQNCTNGTWGYQILNKLNNFVFVGFHVDDSEVTLNVCLGQQFSDGELFFRGIRCDKHVNTEARAEVHCP